MARKNVFTASDGKVIHYLSWIPRTETHAVVQIAHGLAEHSARYEHFAKFLNKMGYSVYANDHRGHGQTISEESERGYFADENGWFRVADDMIEFTKVIKEKEPNKPVIVFGHSMGSFLTRSNLILHPNEYNAAVLSGTSAGAGFVGEIGKIIAKRAIKKDGPRFQNANLDQMSFGAYGRDFEPLRTKFDWLSRDPDQVDLYVDDPLCGFICTSQLFSDNLVGLDHIGKTKNLIKMKKDMPVLFISGSMDPIGGKGKGVTKVFKKFKKAGMQDVTLKLYENGRHSMLIELNRDEVEQYIEGWIREKVPADG